MSQDEKRYKPHCPACAAEMEPLVRATYNVPTPAPEYIQVGDVMTPCNEWAEGLVATLQSLEALTVAHLGMWLCPNKNCRGRIAAEDPLKTMSPTWHPVEDK